MPTNLITLTGGLLGRRYEATWRGNLLALDWDHDFLRPFRERTAGGGYVGLGKTFEALTRFAAATGEPDLLALREHVLAAIVDGQADDGYLGWFAPEHRVLRLWDVHELGYLILALVTDARLHGATGSLQAAGRAADWLLPRLTAEALATLDESIGVHLSVCGLDRALLALTAASGQPRYRQFVADAMAIGRWDLPLVLERHGRIEGHAYAYLTRALAQLELAGVSAPSNRAERFLLRGDGLAISGTCGQAECWHNDQRGHGDLGETCTTAYLLRWQGYLARQDHDPRRGDLLERCVYNSLLAAQSPDGRKLRYYTAQEGPRVWWDKDTYCCPGNFRRIMAELPGLIGHTTSDGLVLDLYTPARWDTVHQGVAVRLTIETADPSEGTVALLVEPERPVQFALGLRIPGWASGAELAVNDAPQACSPGRATLLREWRAGDRIELRWPLPWRLVKGRGVNAGRAAVMRGPQLYCLAEPAPDQRVVEAGSLVAVPDHDWRLGAVGGRITSGGRALRLREFPDPAGLATFLRFDRLDQAVDDELCAPR